MTGFGKKVEFYEKGVVASEKCAAAALALGSVKKYIHLSSAYVYKAEKVGAEGVGEGGFVLRVCVASRFAAGGSVPGNELGKGCWEGEGRLAAGVPCCEGAVALRGETPQVAAGAVVDVD